MDHGGIFQQGVGWIGAVGNGMTGQMSADAESNCFADNRHALILEIKEKSLINKCFSVEILK